MFGDLVVLPLYIQTRSALDHDFHSSLIIVEKGGGEKKKKTQSGAHRIQLTAQQILEDENKRKSEVSDAVQFPPPECVFSPMCPLHSTSPPVGKGLDWAQSSASRNKRGSARCLAGGLQGAAARLIVRTWRRIEH